MNRCTCCAPLANVIDLHVAVRLLEHAVVADACLAAAVEGGGHGVEHGDFDRTPSTTTAASTFSSRGTRRPGSRSGTRPRAASTCTQSGAGEPGRRRP